MIRGAWLISIGAAVLGLGASTGGGVRAATDDPPQTRQALSASALYNLGNSYARSGKPAMAVLNYERARLLAPMDPDIQANLRHVRESLGLPAQSGSWLNRHSRLADPDTMYWLGVFGLSAAGASLLLRRLGSRHPNRTWAKPLAAAAVVGLFLTALTLWDSAATASILDQSVVMQASPASASPIAGAEPMFTVPQADVVNVRDEHGEFALIRDSQQREGWVSRSNLIPVIPRSEAPR